MAHEEGYFDQNRDYPSPDHPSRDPENFPPPQQNNCTRISTKVLVKGKIVLAETVLVPLVETSVSTSVSQLSDANMEDEYDSDSSEDDEDEEKKNSSDENDHNKPIKAYWYRKRIKKAIYGTVWRATLLIPCTSHSGVDWQATTEYCAIKEMDCDEIMERNGSAENPIKEVSTMQYCQSYLRQIVQDEQQEQEEGPLDPVEYIQRATQQILEHHIMMPLDVLSDLCYLYLVMPFISGGELFDVLKKHSKFTEEEARRKFCQILKGVEFLQRAGICHRDLSLENLLVDDDGNVVIIDLGMSLKIPYRTGDQDVDHRLRERYLITPQGAVGKAYYMSPEIVRNQKPFDGYAIDLWALGPILFLMVTGFPPWERALLTNQQFNYFSNGYLSAILERWNLELNPDLVDLMQRMFWRDPTARLSLEQILAHPWVSNI